MESIKIENFGPLLNAEVMIKDINIFIGTSSSGKSTAAKLMSIFQNLAFSTKISFENFTTKLSDYNIDFKVNNNTFIHYQNNQSFIEIKGKSINSNFISIRKNLSNSVYIPAERAFLSTISQSIFSLMSGNIPYLDC